MRNAWFTALFLLSFSGLIPADEKVVNFSGMWSRDPAHSTSQHSAPNSGITSVLSGIAGDTGRDSNAGVGQDDSGDVVQMAGEWLEGLSLEIVQTDTELQIIRQFFGINGERKKNFSDVRAGWKPLTECRFRWRRRI